MYSGEVRKKYEFDTGTFLQFLAGDSYSMLTGSWITVNLCRELPMHIIVRVYEKGQFKDGDLYQNFFGTLGLTPSEDFVISESLKNISLMGNVPETKRYM